MGNLEQDPAVSLRESKYQNILGKVILVLAVITSAYHLYGGLFGFPVSMVHRPLHILLLIALYYLQCARKDVKPAKRIWDLAILALSIASLGYLILNSDYMLSRLATVDALRPADIVLGLIFMLIILETARRISGLALTILVSIFILYAYFGRYLPGMFWHRGFSAARIIETTYMGVEGAFGTPIFAVSTYVFLFILFGSFLEATGASDFFTDLATSLTGHSIGGPAKTAVVSSALMGCISGSPVANVVTTGAFTIPLMKKSGYDAKFAAATEAVSSTGGQIMPPVMGTAAFIMVELTGIPYVQIMMRSLFPAILYFTAVFLMVDMEARKKGLRRLSKSEIPSFRQVMKKGYLIIPIIIVVAFLIAGYTPGRTAIFSIFSLLVLVFLFEKDKRRQMGQIIVDAMAKAAKQCIPVTMACAAAGILVGMIQMTGLGLRMTSIVLALSGGRLLIALILTMLMALILGMGMPTSGAYILLAALLTQGLVQMGASLVAAHLFVLYFAGMSSITPPVALATYAAAGIAESKPWPTGLLAFRLGLTAFIIPFMFVYGESLMLLGAPMTIIQSIITALLGIIALAASLQGWLFGQVHMVLRIILFASAMVLIYPGLVTDLIGIFILSITCLYQRHISRKKAYPSHT